jgi:LmbE family N-acetylglucosaminyl deacetylase
VAFLLAHQDDEIMLAPIIADAKREGRPVLVAFFTNGDGGASITRVRNDESRRLLAALGVETEQEVAFLGEQLAVSDGQLCGRLEEMHAAAKSLLARASPIDAIYVHAWEGGNPDHDAAHALGLGLAAALGLDDAVYQVPFYRAPRSGPLPFVLFAPLEANGPATFYPLPLSERLRRLGFVRYFPSQTRTFVRFAPFMLLDALARSGIPVQRANPARLLERPMPEPLRYERIGYVAFSDMAPLIAAYWRGVTGEREARSSRSHDPPCSMQRH